MKRPYWLYALLAVAAAGLLFLLLRYMPGRTVSTPDVLLPDTTSAPASGTDLDPTESTPRLVTVTPETVQAILASLSRADSYSRTVTLIQLWNGGSSERSIDVKVRGDSARYVVSGVGATKNILITDGDLWIWYDDLDGVYHGKATDRDTDAYQSILTYEDILSLDSEAITDASYDDLDGEKCIRCDYADGSLGYRHRVWISVETGLLMASETYDGEAPVFYMRSGPADISTPDESAFLPPDAP